MLPLENTSAQKSPNLGYTEGPDLPEPTPFIISSLFDAEYCPPWSKFTATYGLFLCMEFSRTGKALNFLLFFFRIKGPQNHRMIL